MSTLTEEDAFAQKQLGEINNFKGYVVKATDRNATTDTKKGVYDWLIYFRREYGADFINNFVLNEEGCNLFRKFWEDGAFDYGEAGSMLAHHIQQVLEHDSMSVDEFDTEYGPNSKISRSRVLGLGSGQWIRMKVNNAITKIKNEGECDHLGLLLFILITCNSSSDNNKSPPSLLSATAAKASHHQPQNLAPTLLGAQVPQPSMTGAMGYGFGSTATTAPAPAASGTAAAKVPYTTIGVAVAPTPSMFGPPSVAAPFTPSGQARSVPGSGTVHVETGSHNPRLRHTHSRSGLSLSSGYETPNRNASSLRSLGTTLTTPHRPRYDTEENMYPNALYSDHGSVLSAQLGGLSIGGDYLTMPSSIGIGSSAIRKNSNQLISEAALDRIHNMMCNEQEFTRELSALEESKEQYFQESGSHASAKAHIGWKSFCDGVKAEDDHFNNQQNFLNGRIETHKCALANTPKAADLEKAKVEEEQQKDVRLNDAELNKRLLFEKNAYETKCRNHRDEHARREADLVSTKQDKLSLIENNTKATMAQSEADLAQARQQSESNTNLKEENLTLAKAHVLAVESGFRVFDRLRYVHFSNDPNPDSVQMQKYLAMRDRLKVLQRYIDEGKVNELKRLVWRSQDDDDVSL